MNITAFILAIICMSRSATIVGTIVLAGSLVVTPALYFIGLTLFTAALVGTTSNYGQQSSDHSALNKIIAEATPLQEFHKSETIAISEQNYNPIKARDLGSYEPEMIVIPGKNYALGKYEVTQGQWRAIMGNNPSRFSGCGDDCPVENVSWNDVHEYIKKLNQRTGKTYRLPSSREWNYACVAGTRISRAEGAFCGSRDAEAVSWFDERTHPVGLKLANGYGLYDMSGNVGEWTSDCYDGDCTKHTIEGGAWTYHGNISTSANAGDRSDPNATNREGSYGFRLAFILQDSKEPRFSSEAIKADIIPADLAKKIKESLLRNFNILSTSEIEDIVKNRLSASLLNLDNDGHDDLRVAAVSLYLCGNHGSCPAWFFHRTINGFELVLVANDSVAPTQFFTNGYRNLEGDMNDVYHFDGRCYLEIGAKQLQKVVNCG